MTEPSKKSIFESLRQAVDTLHANPVIQSYAKSAREVLSRVTDYVRDNRAKSMKIFAALFFLGYILTSCSSGDDETEKTVELEKRVSISLMAMIS